MARLNSWLSPDVTRALGWALIHSLWQCLALAAVAAALMALSRRATVRYLVGVGALASMLAFPVATLFVLTTATSPLVSGSLFVAPRNAPAVSTVPIPAAPNAAPSRIETESAQREPDSSQLPPVLRDFRTRLPLLNVLPWLVAAWLSGVAFFSLRFAGGFVLLEHRRRSQTAIPGAGILALCQDVQRQLGFERAIQYLECGWLQAPAVIGWLRPIVLLPVAALTGLTEDQLRAVIAHELAHVRRFDALVNLFQVLVETLLFYHPAVWWLNKRIRAERELCCDEIAVAASGNRLEYAKALTLMAEWESAPRLAMAANRGSLPERVLHILGRKPTGAGQRMIGLTGSVLFLVAAVAAANALLTIAAPPIAQAKESVRAVLSASQATVDHLARLVLRADEPTTSIPSPHQVHQVTPIIPMVMPDQVAKDATPENLSPPPTDLSGLPPVAAPPTPTIVASDATPAMNRNGQTGSPVQLPAPAATTPAPAAPSTDTPRPKTEAGMRCLLGLGPDGCWRQFESHPKNWDVWTLWVRPGKVIDCISENWGVGCPFGPLERIEYLGANATGEDVYSVKFLHSSLTYVLRPPGTNGKIARYCANDGTGTRCSGDRNTPLSSMTVASPAGQRQILYMRAPQGSDRASAVASGAAPPRPKTEAGMACLLGLAPWGCQDVMFDSKTSASARYETQACAGPNAPFGEVQGLGCPHGPLEAVDYLGSNESGADVYHVKYMHTDFTYVIMPPGPDGTIGKFWIRGGKPSGDIGSSLVRVTSLTAPRAIFRRAKIGIPNTPATQSTANAAGGPVTGTAALWAAQNEHAVMPSTPSGEGDANLVVCRAPQPFPGSSQSGPEVCLYNYEWLKVARNGKDVAPDGKTLIDKPTGTTPAAVTGPRPGTAEAVQCLLRQSPPACEQMFVGKASQVATAWVYVSAEQNFNRGPLISSNYWGRGSDVNIYLKSPGIIPKANLDVFDIKFAHRNYTFWISPPDADGKIRDVIVPVP